MTAPPSADRPRRSHDPGRHRLDRPQHAGADRGGPELYRVEAVTGLPRRAALAALARDARGARLAVIADPAAYGELKERLAGTGIEAAAGTEAVVEAAQRPADG